MFFSEIGPVRKWLTILVIAGSLVFMVYVMIEEVSDQEYGVAILIGVVGFTVFLAVLYGVRSLRVSTAVKKLRPGALVVIGTAPHRMVTPSHRKPKRVVREGLEAVRARLVVTDTAFELWSHRDKKAPLRSVPNVPATRVGLESVNFGRIKSEDWIGRRDSWRGAIVFRGPGGQMFAFLPDILTESYDEILAAKVEEPDLPGALNSYGEGPESSSAEVDGPTDFSPPSV